MYTVKQLSRLAGITPRTLHYYDQIGLLKPSRLGRNGYRYYDQASLLRLQQILLYRELEMPLDKIKALVEDQDFDVLSALQAHKQQLARRIAQLQRLMTTVDDTLSYLKGKQAMSDRQFFEGFSEEQQAEYEQDAMQMYDPVIVKASNQKWKNYSPAEKQRIGEQGNAAYAALLAAMPQGPASPAAQAGVEAWRRHIENFWIPNDEQLLGLTHLYNDDPRFKANFDKIDPGLAAFMRAAVQVYVEKRRKAG